MKRKQRPSSTARFSRGRLRRGTAAAEAALIAPVLVLILLGAIDLGQYVNMAQTVSNASREGARLACRDQTETVAEVTTAIQDYLLEAFPSLSASDLAAGLEITIRDETEDVVITSDLTEIASGSQLSVLVNLDFGTVRWLNGVDYWNGEFKETMTITRRE